MAGSHSLGEHGVTSSFVVYVDESGDEGFLKQGSSTWFVLAAAITDKSQDLQTVKLIDRVRLRIGRQPDDHQPLHFRKLKHEMKLPYLAEIAAARLKSVVVAVHKPSIRNVEYFETSRWSLYYFATKLLLERVSWYCHDFAPIVGGDGSAEVLFSNRSAMNYEDLRTHLKQVKARGELQDTQINWHAIDIDRVRPEKPGLMGLQVADAIASSFFFALNPSQYGFAEPRYASMLKPVLYHQHGRYEGFGIKLWPSEFQPESESHLSWLSDVYGFS